MVKFLKDLAFSAVLSSGNYYISYVPNFKVSDEFTVFTLSVSDEIMPTLFALN
jgi:hypothetical protein